MSTASIQPQEPAVSKELPPAKDREGSRSVVAWSSFFFAVLQSLCTFFGAANGLRTLIGVGAITLSTSAATFVTEFHSSWFRRPMNGLAVAGALLNLIVLWQIRRLRARPAAHWRQTPVSTKKLRSERIQFVLSIATLMLVGVEEYLHLIWHGRL